MLFTPDQIRAAAGTVRNGVHGAADQISDLIELMGRATALVGDAEKLVTRANAALAGAERQLEQSERLLTRADALLDETDRMVAPLRPIVAQTVPVLSRALPMVNTLFDGIDPDELDAIGRTINHLPVLVDTLEKQLIPNLEVLEQLGPDVHEILENVADLSTAIMGMPGMGFIQRRGAQRQDEEDEHEHEQASDKLDDGDSQTV